MGSLHDIQQKETLTGLDLIDIGFPQSPLLGIALRIYKIARQNGIAHSIVVYHLKEVLKNPNNYLHDALYNPLAEKLVQ